MNGVDNAHIARAAAQIADQRLSDLFFSWLWIPLQQCGGRHQHSWRAETTLYSIVLHKCFLQGTQSPLRSQPFHRDDLPAIGFNSQYHARVYRFAIQQHRAGPALPRLAAILGAGEGQLLSKHLQ